MEALITSTKFLANTLDEVQSSEAAWSKKIRRYLERFNGTESELAAELRGFIAHEDGLLNSIDNELIQLCYASTDTSHDKSRVKMCISLISAKTDFVKQLLLLSENTSGQTS